MDRHAVDAAVTALKGPLGSGVQHNEDAPGRPETTLLVAAIDHVQPDDLVPEGERSRNVGDGEVHLTEGQRVRVT